MGTININKAYITTNNTYTGENHPKYIVIHETDNFAEGAGAERHASAQAAGDLSTSVHYYAGSDGVYQAAAHADGVYAIGVTYDDSHSIKDATNRNTISIEICVNEDGDYSQARRNAIELVKYVMKETGIPAERVVRHFDVKGKYCPRNMMDDPALWEDFKRQIGQGQTDAYTQRQFILDVQKATGSNPDGIAGPETIGNTITVSASRNRKHPVVIPLQKRLNILGHDCGAVDGIAGSKFTTAVKSYQRNVLGYHNLDGEITAGKKMWKSLLGML